MTKRVCRVSRVVGPLAILCFAGTAAAQVELAVVSPAGHCASHDLDVPWVGNYIVPTGQHATFQCGLDSAQTPPGEISRVVVYVDAELAEREDRAWARLCYRAISESLNPTCGPTEYQSSNQDTELDVEPPKEVPDRPVVAYLEVYIPAPAPGYHFFNGYRILAP